MRSRGLHLILTEDLLHVLIEPLQLVADAELKVLRHLANLLTHKSSLILNPLVRAHRRPLDSRTRHLCVVVLLPLDRFHPSKLAAKAGPIRVLLTVHVPRDALQAECAVWLVRGGGGGLRRVC